MADRPQTYANHARLVPAFHYVALPILAVNFFSAAWRLIQQPSFDRLLSFLVAVALVIIAFAARIFALTAQDRIIRLEMRLRLTAQLPKDQHARIMELTRDQLVALRFASDAELPGLVEHVLTRNVRDKKTIKQMVKNWTADHLRV